jgi:hypothetical protein
MKPQLTTKQLMAAQTLLRNLDKFIILGYGTIDGLAVLQQNDLPNTSIVKYQKNYEEGGEIKFAFQIATIDQNGTIEFIQDKFTDVFQKSQFLAETMPLNLENESTYDKID